MPMLLTQPDDSSGKGAHGLNISARGKTHARSDIHVGAGSAHHLLRGLSGPVRRAAWLGRSVRALADRADGAHNNFRAPAAAVTGRGAISPT